MSERYTFRSHKDSLTITEVATSRLEALALAAWTLETAHGIDKPERLELVATKPIRYDL